MAWLDLPQLIAFLGGIALCAVTAWRLMRSRIRGDRARHIAWILCAGALVGGVFIASATTPDWSPIAILWLYLPYFAFGVWALYFSLLTRKGRDAHSAGRRAFAWTIPSLLLAPLVAVIIVLVIAVV